jgi:hypothetical protein
MSGKRFINTFIAGCCLAGCSGNSADTQPPAGDAAASISSSSTAPPASSQTTAAISILDVAGKTPLQVAAVLGPPNAQETIHSRGKPYTKRLYHDGDIEIVYVRGRADWITIFGHGQLPFGPDVLPALGLSTAEPTFANPDGVYRWESIPGLKEVSVFLGQGGRAQYAYVLVSTKP